jgi:hypothetical protein
MKANPESWNLNATPSSLPLHKSCLVHGAKESAKAEVSAALAANLFPGPKWACAPEAAYDR